MSIENKTAKGWKLYFIWFLNKIVNVPNLGQLCQSLVFFYLKICYSPVTANKHIDNIEGYFGKQNFSSSRCHMFLRIFSWNHTRHTIYILGPLILLPASNQSLGCLGRTTCTVNSFCTSNSQEGIKCTKAIE